MPIELVHHLGAYGVLCLLCAGPGDLTRPDPPSARWNIEAAGVYATFQRPLLDEKGIAEGPGDEFDGGDTTPHGVAVEAGRRWPSTAGAGSPRKEFAFGVLEATTHNEAQTKKPYGTQPTINTTGNGRFESVWIKVRYPVSERGSLELAVDRPYYTEADIVVAGDDLYFGSSRRNLLTDVRNTALGYRHFGDGYEIAAQAVWTDVRTQYGTGRAFLNGSGTVWGATAEALVTFGAWRGQVFAGYQHGTIGVEGGFFPHFEPWTGDFEHTRTFVATAAGRRWGRWGAALALRGVWIRSPYWDSGGFANTEMYEIDQGRSFSLSSREFFGDFTGSYDVSETLRFSASILRRHGDDQSTMAPTLPGVAPSGYPGRRRGWGCGVAVQVRVP